MVTCSESDGIIRVETSAYSVAVRTRDYTTGTMAGTFTDKLTGVHDPGWGLHIWDFLMAPGWRDDGYARDWHHGNLPKHIVEEPQICTRVPQLDYAIIRGPSHVAVRVRYTFTKAGEGYTAGSQWQQTVLFVDGLRHFFSDESIRIANDADNLFYRMDMPGHIAHRHGDTFKQVYLSYHGLIPAGELLDDFAPDARFLYNRDDARIPDRFIRAYQLPGGWGGRDPWLAGMTLDPSAPCQAWCHQRGYVCFIQENHGRAVRKGQTIGAAYVLGYFDSVDEMNAVYDTHKGKRAIEVDEKAWSLE